MPLTPKPKTNVFSLAAELETVSNNNDLASGMSARSVTGKRKKKKKKRLRNSVDEIVQKVIADGLVDRDADRN